MANKSQPPVKGLFQAEIELVEPLESRSDIYLEENNEEAVNEGNHEDVPVELSTFIVIVVDGGVLP